jgi:hypothetical protein
VQHVWIPQQPLLGDQPILLPTGISKQKQNDNHGHAAFASYGQPCDSDLPHGPDSGT